MASCKDARSWALKRLSREDGSNECAAMRRYAPRSVLEGL